MNRCYNYIQLLQEINMLKRFFQYVRVIDPFEETEYVLQESDQTFQKKEYVCFRYGYDKKRCKQCINELTIKDNKEYSKYEFYNGKLYLVLSYPIQYEGRNLALELIKVMEGEKALDISGFDVKRYLNQIKEERFTDILTGVLNRRYIIEVFPKLITDLIRKNENLCLAMVDVDHFKQINDTVGHMGGDEAIRYVASFLQGRTRACMGDFVARFGGDEFILVFQNITFHEAKELLLELESDMKGLQFQYEETSFSISLSVGACCLNEIKEKKVDELLTLADKRLYLAKKRGRGCIVMKE